MKKILSLAIIAGVLWGQASYARNENTFVSETYDLVGQITSYKTIDTTTALVEFPLQFFESGFEYKIDVVGNSESGPYRVKVMAQKPTSEQLIKWNRSSHALRARNKSVYLSRNMFPTQTQNVIIYGVPTDGTARVMVKLWKSKVTYDQQKRISLKNYVQFAQKSAGSPLATKGAGLNALLHALHLKTPTAPEFTPNKDNLWALHNTLISQDSTYAQNNTANLTQVKALADQNGGSVLFDSGSTSQFGLFLLGGITQGKAVIVPVVIDDNNPANLLSSGTKKHFVLVVGFSQNGSGNTIVFIKDPLTADSQTRIVPFSLLSASNATHNAGQYQALYLQ